MNIYSQLEPTALNLLRNNQMEGGSFCWEESFHQRRWQVWGRFALIDGGELWV